MSDENEKREDAEEQDAAVKRKADKLIARLEGALEQGAVDMAPGTLGRIILTRIEQGDRELRTAMFRLAESVEPTKGTGERELRKLRDILADGVEKNG